MTPLRRARLAIEMISIYAAAPIAAHYLVYGYRLPLLKLFPLVLAAFAASLIFQKGNDWLDALRRLPGRGDVLKILALFVLCGGALTVYAAQSFPQYFLSFPARAPGLWLRVMILYPLISVTAQEIFFRVFYFHRYAPLFGPHAHAAIAVNAALFAFAHAVLFAHRGGQFYWQAVAISFIGGCIFARRFAKTRSFWAVAMEHSLYGDLIFTAGLGLFFFTGVSNL